MQSLINLITQQIKDNTASSKHGVNNQANNNLIRIGLYHQDGCTLFSQNKVKAIIDTLINGYRTYKPINYGQFYIWYDSQLGQLRASIIDSHFALPFSCKINTVSNPQIIINDIYAEIASLYKKIRLMCIANHYKTTHSS